MANSFKAVQVTMAEIMASIQKSNREEKPRRAARAQIGKGSLGSKTGKKPNRPRRYSVASSDDSEPDAARGRSRSGHGHDSNS